MKPKKILLGGLSALVFGIPASASAGPAIHDTNWAGYAVTAAPRSHAHFIESDSTFNVPTLDCKNTKGENHTGPTPQGSANGVSIWAGIDGLPIGAQHVEQTGVWAWCDKSGKPQYRGFVEMAPAPPVFLSASAWPVHAGDLMRATVYANTPNDFTLGLVNWRSHPRWGKSYIMQTAFRTNRLDAEAIVERPFPAPFVTSFDGSVNFIADAFIGAALNQAPFYADTPWSVAHRMVAIGLPLQTGSVSHDRASGTRSAFSVTSH